MTYLFTNERGETHRKTLRNCDRCMNIQDAKGRFRAETKNADGANFWSRLAKWLMEDAK